MPPGGTAEALPLSREALAVAKEWRDSFTTFGFASIIGHGVPDNVIEDAYSAARQFFNLSPETKQKYDLGKGYGAGGYIAQGVERVSATASKPDGSELLGAEKARPPDKVESMVVHRKPYDPMPVEVPGYQKSVHAYHDEMTMLLRVIMSLTACSLDLPVDYFEPHFFGEGGVGPAFCVGECSLRMAHYPAWEEGTEPLPGQLRYGEHTDYTGFTVLWQDHNTQGPQTATDGKPPDGGLQVRMPDGSWVDCPPIPGAFTVNAGDLIQVWTNDVLLSNLHRVRNPPPGDRNDRISLVFFTGPTPETSVCSLPTCCSSERPARYPPITAGEHLQMKLKASNK